MTLYNTLYMLKFQNIVMTVEKNLKDAVGISVRNSVRDSVEDSVWGSVWDSVADSVRESVSTIIKEKEYNSIEV